MKQVINKGFDYYYRLSYRIEIIEDEDEGGFVLSHPDLKGCITTSESVEKGIALLTDAKAAWINAAIEEGYPIPEPDGTGVYSGQFKLRIPKSLHKELAENARLEGVSMNQYCLHILSKNRTHSRKHMS